MQRQEQRLDHGSERFCRTSGRRKTRCVGKGRYQRIVAGGRRQDPES